jgi:uncharacterized protein YjbJ (UPF0337 family)
LINRGLPHFRFGKLLRIKPSDVDEFERRNVVRPNDKEASEEAGTNCRSASFFRAHIVEERTPAMGSTSDKIKGKATEVAGKARQAVGRAVDNHEEQVKGKVQEARGKTQVAKGEVKDAVKKFVDNA